MDEGLKEGPAGRNAGLAVGAGDAKALVGALVIDDEDGSTDGPAEEIWVGPSVGIRDGRVVDGVAEGFILMTIVGVPEVMIKGNVVGDADKGFVGTIEGLAAGSVVVAVAGFSMGITVGEDDS
jgi:hypothetical protein